ncbi:MAG: isoprenylcysteine carboxylmethyltransferase family protein [Actinomycetota bacterium]
MRALLPPVLFLLLAVVSVPIGALVPLAGPTVWPIRLLGFAGLIGGLALTTTGVGLFNRVRTNIVTFNDPERFVTSGPFRYTRNPMYLGFLIALTGLALAVGVASAFIGPLAFWAAANFWYIPFEEGRLTETFGAEYTDYQRRVGRWIAPVGRLR